MLPLRMNKLCLFFYFVYIFVGGEGTCSSGGTVTSWSGWTCNIENSTATRTGNCTDDEHVSETVKVTVYSWTSWSPWSPSCGAAEVHRSRLCVVPSPDSVYCSTCGHENTTRLQNKPSNLPPCCEAPGSTARLPPKSQIPLTSSPTPTTSTTSSPTSATATTSSATSATSTTSSPTSTTSSATSTTSSPTSTTSSPTSTTSSATSTTSSSAAYMWPLVAVSVTAIIVSAILVVVVIAIVLHYKKKGNSNSYHLIPQHQSGDTLGCDDQGGDIPSCPPPPYSVQSDDYCDDGNSVINNETIFSDLNTDADNSRECERVLRSEERRDCSRNNIYSTGKDQITEAPFGNFQS